LPLVELFPPFGHRVFVDFDARISGVCGGARWMTELAIESCQHNPRLTAELLRRVRALFAGIRGKEVLPQCKAFGILPQDPPKPDANILRLEPDALARQARDLRVDRGSDPDGAYRSRVQKAAHARTMEAWERRRVPPIEYVDEPDPDLWRALSAAAEHFPGQAWRGDCDCITAWINAFIFTRMTQNVGAGISQPKTCACDQRCRGEACELCGYGMAHEYSVVCDTDLPAWFVELCHEIPPEVVIRDRLPGRTPDRIRRAIRAGAPVLAFDASVYCGMGSQIERGRLVMYPPPRKFYGAGESAFRFID
jgi:hypothetical protein